MYKLEADCDIGFVAHPRTGSRTVRDEFMRLGATKHAGHHQVDEVACRDILQKGGIIMCTVRNMFDVLVSWYYNAHFNGNGDVLNATLEVPTFEKYVYELIENPKHRWFMTPIYHYGLPWAQVRMRYENLREDFDHEMESLGVEEVGELGHVGKSVNRDPDYRNYYGRDLRLAVEARWGEDLHLTGYEF